MADRCVGLGVKQRIPPRSGFSDDESSDSKEELATERQVPRLRRESLLRLMGDR